MIQSRRESGDEQDGSGRPPSSVPTLLKALLRERNLQNYGMFKRAYQKAARGLDKDLVETYPSVQTFRRWLAGQVKTLPHAEHCAVLAAILPGWTAADLLRPYIAPGDSAGSTLLQELLRRRCIHDYPAFCRAYNIAAAAIDKSLVGTYPAEPQFHRWISGDMIGLPYPDHCNVLEAMFPGYSARQLFQPHQDDPSPTSDKTGTTIVVPEPTETYPSRDADRLTDLVQPWELADVLTHATISGITLDHIERAVFSYVTRYPCTPPAALLPAVSGHLPRLYDALNRPQPLQMRRRAVTLLGVLSGLAGNLWLDLGREDQAAGFFDIGELAGQEAEDPDLTAWVLATRSIGPFFAGQYRNAADLLARAEDAAARRSSPRRRAWVTALRARAAAAVGDHHLSRTALERAHQHMAAVSEPPSGTEFFDEARLDGLAGTAYLLMTDTHQAVPLLTQAQDRRASADAKGRALVTLDLAECHAVDHEPEEAARLAVHALDDVDGSIVAPIVIRARRLLAGLHQWSELAAVRELDNRLAELSRG